MSLITKKKRVSKKTKLSWRKHVDIRDVENFLEEQRLEERLGKPVSEKTNEELFQVDTKPASTQELTTKQKRRLSLRQSTPKCFSMLQSHTEVPDPLIKRNRVKTKEERKNALVRKNEDERRRRGILKAKELQSLNDKKLNDIQRANKPKKGDFNTDIWHSDDNKLLSTEWITNATKKHTLRGTAKLAKTVPKSVQTRRSILPPVEPPHPGTSYNPSFADHQALLQEIMQNEVKIIKEEDHLNRVTRGMFSKVTLEEKNHNWLIEMSEGLPKDDKESINENENGDYKAINLPVQNKKKSLKQRRKQKEHQQLEQARRTAKQEKKKIADIHRLRLLKQQLDKNEKKTEILRTKRLKKKIDKQKEPKRLSSLKFQEQEIAINMPEDIAGTLRNIKKEGSLLMDRFKSLQKRNVLQPTTKHSHVKAKVKRFKRPGHKDDWKVTVARSKNKL